MKPTARPFPRLLPYVSLPIMAALCGACQPMSDSQQSNQASEQTSILARDQITVDSDGEIVPPEPVADSETDKLGIDAERVNEFQNNYIKAINQMNAEMALMLSMNNVDVAFARGMLGHHRGAVDLTKFEKRYGTDQKLRALAETISLTEQGEIDALRRWLASHPDTHDIEPTTEAARQDYQYAITAMQNRMVNALDSTNPDIAFAQTILAHHRGAEAIANIQLKYGKDEEMRALAQQIINEQLDEMDALILWLNEHGINAAPKLVQQTPDITTDPLAPKEEEHTASGNDEANHPNVENGKDKSSHTHSGDSQIKSGD